MAYEEVITLEADRTITIGGKDKKTGKLNPTSAEGYYLGNRVVKGGKFGDSTLHFLQTSEGNLGVWGKTNLDGKLAQVQPGTMILINYTGMKPTKSGDMHTYQLKFDKENVIDVGNLELNASSVNSGSGDSDEGVNTYDDGNDDEDIYEEPVRNTQIAGKSAAERKAQVDALLRKSKN